MLKDVEGSGPDMTRVMCRDLPIETQKTTNLREYI